MQTFSIRDLRDRSGELTREAEAGRLSLVTRHGQPLFVSVPFTGELLQHGVRAALGVTLFKQGDISLGKAAEIAGMQYAQFLVHVSSLGIPIMEYGPGELEAELKLLGG
jgi:predicted HTH domain antitoxin